MRTPDEMWQAVGEMLQRSQREEVEPNEARERFNTWVRGVAAGGAPTDLSVETVWQLGELKEELLPDDVAQTLGLEPGAEYGKVFDSMFATETH
jgi:hypothetical protein